jgi:hypothetical protein
MRQDVEFKTEDGITLRGWHYLPDNRSGKVPTIMMAHGFSTVKEIPPGTVCRGVRQCRPRLDRI